MRLLQLFVAFTLGTLAAGCSETELKPLSDTDIVDDTAIVDVIPGEPVADAGPNLSVSSGAIVGLDAGASYDPDGLDPLLYAWTMISSPSGSSAKLDSVSLVTPVFTVDVDGNYVFELTVQNSAGVWDPTPDTVTVASKSSLFQAPIADAGPDQRATEADTVLLDGSASFDPAGLNPLAYAWSITQAPSGSAATLDDPASVIPAFLADLPGSYELSLTVQNSAGVWDPTPDATQIDVSALPVPPPIADAGPDQGVTSGTVVSLDGSASLDPSGLSPLSYAWSWTSRPSNSSAYLSNSSVSGPSFSADVDGVYAFELMVQNTAGVWSTAPDRVLVTVDTVILEPVADAGADQNVSAASMVVVDGSASFDPQGLTPLSYAWTLQSRPTGSAASVSSSTNVTTSFYADAAGTYVLELSVCNSANVCDPSPDTVVISADAPLVQPPVADAGADQTLAPLVTVSLDGTASYDPGGYSPLSYVWSLQSRPTGSTAALNNTAAAQPQFFADLAGDYVFELSVRNSQGIWDPTPDLVVITAEPIDGFYVEVSWDNSNDLDMHVLDGSSGLYGPGDCNYCNMTPNFGGAGSLDDPSLDWDAIDGWGPETSTITSPASGNYDIQVVYYGVGGAPDCGGLWGTDPCPVSTARVKVFLSGVLSATYTRTLSQSGQVWDVASLAWPSRALTTHDSVTTTGLTGCW